MEASATAHITWVGFLIMVLLGGGRADLVSLLDGPGYIRSHGIEANVDSMTELAARKPEKHKGEIGRLLALRWLAEHPEKVKASGKVAEVLRKVEGITEETEGIGGSVVAYAHRAAVALGSEKQWSAPTRGTKALQEALAWFPGSVRLAGALELSAAEDLGTHSKALEGMLSHFLPPKEWALLADVAEKIGNVRIDRLAFADAVDQRAPLQAKFYLRLTGQVNHKRLLEYLRDHAPTVKLEDRKPAKGPPVTLILPSPRRDAPGILLVGNTDLLVGVFEKGGPLVDHVEVAEQMLAVRSGKEKSALAGKLAKSLQKVPERAAGFLVGDLPPEVRTNLTRGPDSLHALPSLMLATLQRAKGGLEVQWEGDFPDAKQAATFAEDVTKLRQKALTGLQHLAGLEKTKGPGHLVQTLEGMKVEADGATVQGRLEVSRGAAADLVRLFLDEPRRQPAQPSRPEAAPTRKSPAGR
jgi:hypothetical protein